MTDAGIHVSVRSSPDLWQRRRLLYLTLLLAAAASCTHLPFKGNRYGVLTGRVQAAEDGSPLAGASITLRSTGISGSTDAQGNFSLRHPNIASDSITVSRSGFVPFTIPAIPLAAGDTIQFRAELLRADAVPPNARQVCGFDFPADRNCASAVSPYDGPIVIVDAVLIMRPGPGIDHPSTHLPIEIFSREVMNISVVTGPKAASLYGTRAWFGVAVINTRACQTTRNYDCGLTK